LDNLEDSCLRYPMHGVDNLGIAHPAGTEFWDLRLLQVDGFQHRDRLVIEQGVAFRPSCEGLASVIVIWRFTGTRTIAESAERRAQKWVGVSFFLLAPYVAAEAIETLIEGAAAETSWLGIALTAGTLLLCPWLGRAKQRIGEKLGSRATYGEGTQNVLCAILAAAVLVGLTANTLFGLWWLDPAIALAISAMCVREGQKAWHGEQCGCATCS
jgi:hypothetical protein